MDADQGSAWQTRESRSWNTMTIDKMVGIIARMHGVQAEVSIIGPEIVLPQVEQTDESDLHLLLRLAAQYNLLVKPAVGKLIVMRRTDTSTPGGTSIPTITITPQDIADWDFDLGNRLRYNKVIATYHDLATGQPVECTAGTGDVQYRHPGAFSNALDAQAAADAYLHAFQRGGATFSFSLPGRGDLRADMMLSLAGFRDGFDGDGWKIENAEHRLDRSGYSLTISGTNRTAAGAEAEQAAMDEGFSTDEGDGLTDDNAVEPITT
jgi:phage protein D